jgi:hypothetical protein
MVNDRMNGDLTMFPSPMMPLEACQGRSIVEDEGQRENPSRFHFDG